MNAVKELGKRLAARLDEDDWGYIEPFLNECETELESLRQRLAECRAELRSTRLRMIAGFGRCREAHEKVKELTDQVLAASNLLAVMHRDGGHHQLAVGFDQAIQDAMAVYYGLTAQRDAAIVDAVRYRKYGSVVGCGDTFDKLTDAMAPTKITAEPNDE